MNRKYSLLTDLVGVLGIVIASLGVILYFRLGPLTSAVLFFLLPSVYLLSRHKEKTKRIVAGSFLIGLVCGFIFEFLNEVNESWSFDYSKFTFSFRVFGLVPVDVVIWYFLWAFSIIVFYEHFLEHDRTDKLSPRYVRALILPLIVLAAVVLVYYLYPLILHFPFSYLILATIACIPLLYLLWNNPSLIKKFLLISPYFLFLLFSYEIVAVKLGHWYWTGRYIKNINFTLLGVWFPLEELVFWIILGSTVVLSYYELYVDDGK